MNLLKYWLFITSVLLSLSSTAAVGVSDKVITDNQQSQVLLTLNENQLRLLVKRTTADEPSLDPTLDNSLSRTTPHRSFGFNSDAQLDPDFQLLIEFAPFDNVFALQYLPEQKPIPWYLSAAVSKSRLHGWKDSNNLYKSNLSYHG